MPSFKITDFNAKFQRQIRSQIAAPALGAGPTEKPKPVQRREGEDRRTFPAETRMGYCISLIQVRRRLLDEHDNLRISTKPTVDAITKWLGFSSDGDPLLRWEYGQIVTAGDEGMIVKIESLKPK